MSFFRALFLWVRLVRQDAIAALYRDTPTRRWYVMLLCDDDKVEDCLKNVGSLMRWNTSIMEYLVFSDSRPFIVRFYQPETLLDRLVASTRGEQ